MNDIGACRSPAIGVSLSPVPNGPFLRKMDKYYRYWMTRRSQGTTVVGRDAARPYSVLPTTRPALLNRWSRR